MEYLGGKKNGFQCNCSIATLVSIHQVFLGLLSILFPEFSKFESKTTYRSLYINYLYKTLNGIYVFSKKCVCHCKEYLSPPPLPPAPTRFIKRGIPARLAQLVERRTREHNVSGHYRLWVRIPG